MLDKGIEHGKEHRRPYYRAQAVAKSCRCHGGCPYCESNRKYKYVKREQSMDYELRDYWESDRARWKRGSDGMGGLYFVCSKCGYITYHELDVCPGCLSEMRVL